jgi:hypothetical protein
MRDVSCRRRTRAIAIAAANAPTAIATSTGCRPRSAPSSVRRLDQSHAATAKDGTVSAA